MVFGTVTVVPTTVKATETYSELNLSNLKDTFSVYSLIDIKLPSDVTAGGNATGMNQDGNSSNISAFNDAQLSLSEDKNMLYMDGTTFGNDEGTGLYKYELVPGENGENGYIAFRDLADYVHWGDGATPYNWQIGLSYSYDTVQKDIFTTNAGVYTNEFTLRFNEFSIKNGQGRGIYFNVGRWPSIASYVIYADAVVDGYSYKPAVSMDINAGDTVRYKIESDTVAKTNKITVTNLTTGAEGSATAGIVYHNTSAKYQMYDIAAIGLTVYESMPKGVSFDILNLRMYKNLSSPSASNLSVAGELTEGKTVTLNYDYVDGSRERLSEIKWYTTDDETGETGLLEVSSGYVTAGDTAEARQYVLKSSDAGKYLVAEITPNSCASRPLGTDVGVSPGEPKRIVAGLVSSKQDAVKHKLGEVREIDGKKYYQIYDISEMENGDNALLIDKSGSASAELKDGEYVQTVSQSGDYAKTTARLFGLDDAFTDVTASEYLIEMDVNIKDAEDETFAIDVLDSDSRTIASAGIKAEDLKDSFYVDYINEDGDADKAAENYNQGNIKSILLKLNKADNTVSCLTDGLELITDAESILGLTNLFAVRFGLTSGKGTAEVSRLNVLIPADEVIGAAFDASINSLGFSTEKENFIKADIELPTEGYLGTQFKWQSSDESVISNTGVVGRFDERKKVTLTAELYSESLDNAGLVSSKSQSYNFILEALNLSREDLLDDAYITANVNAGKSAFVHDSDSSGSKDLTTAWDTSENAESYLQFDLKSVKPFNSYMVTGSDLGDYRFEASEDGKTYTEVKLLTTAEAAKAAKTAETAASARYLRMVFPQGSAAQVSDIELYFNPTAADIVKFDFDNLNINVPYVVTSDLVLPVRGDRGSTVTWTSGNTEILSNDGTILSRPASDTIVLLTYTVSSATDSTVPGKSNTLRAVIKGKGTSGGSSSGGGGGTSSQGNKVNTSVSLSPGGYASPAKTETFSDLSGADWAKDYILQLYNDKVISGYPDGSFKPNNLVAREEFVQIIGNAFELESGDSVNFEDVPSDAYYYDNLKKAIASGIISGVDGASFGTGENLTRQDLAVIAYRILKHFDVASDEAEVSFYDSGEISDYAKEAVAHLKAAGILNGDLDNRFNPQEGATRAEIAKVICMLKEYMTERANG